MTQIRQSHVSELAIDRMIAGELSGPDARVIRDHAASCAPCSELYDDALRARQSFAFARPRLSVPRSRGRATTAAIGVVLAAAVALAVVIPRTARTTAAEDTVRAKGTAFAGFFVAHGDRVRRGGLSETVSSGDRIELFTTTPAAAATSEAGWFAAVSEDAAGVRTTYIEARPIVPGREQLLPMSIELDATAGREQVTAIFCPHAFAAVAIDLRAPPADCTLDHFALVKAPR